MVVLVEIKTIESMTCSHSGLEAFVQDSFGQRVLGCARRVDKAPEQYWLFVGDRGSRLRRSA
jgi:hypothetical protein